MKKKDILIAKINQFLLDNEVESVELTEVDRSFETSTGCEEGSIEITTIMRDEFTYFPAGQDDGEDFSGELIKLSVSDLEEILDALQDFATDRFKTEKRIS